MIQANSANVRNSFTDLCSENVFTGTKTESDGLQMDRFLPGWKWDEMMMSGGGGDFATGHMGG